MTKKEFMMLMQFPKEWEILKMYPHRLFLWQLSGYEEGHEQASEHDRNGAFHWWLRQQPSKEKLRNLLRLAAIDPDPALGNDVRRYVQIAATFDEELAADDQKFFSNRFRSG